MMPGEAALPRACGEPLGVGVLKQSAEDFFVSELLGFPLDGQGEHVCLRIRKRGQNTAWVAQQLARFAGVRDFDVSYAGRKDRHAVTEQWFSVWLPGLAEPDWQALALDDVTILENQRHGKKLRRGCHSANRFRVILRDVKAGEADGDIPERLSRIASLGFPNYFGEQRFGHGGGNLERADALLSGRARADRKKDLYLSAARSHLFNLELASRIADDTWLAEDAYGWLPGVHRKPPSSLFRAEGFDSWYEGLERLGVKAMRRDLCARAEGLEWSLSGGALTLDFSLETGVFATSLLREVVDVRQTRTDAGMDVDE